MEHEAGRDLDALIAEKVMGWRNIQKRSYGSMGNGPHFHGGEIGYEDGTTILREMIPSYSTDIAAAWQVWEYMKQDQQRWRYFVEALTLLVKPGPEGLGEDDELLFVFRMITPPNICRAALKWAEAK